MLKWWAQDIRVKGEMGLQTLSEYLCSQTKKLSFSLGPVWIQNMGYDQLFVALNTRTLQKFPRWVFIVKIISLKLNFCQYIQSSILHILHWENDKLLYIKLLIQKNMFEIISCLLLNERSLPKSVVLVKSSIIFRAPWEFLNAWLFPQKLN